MKNVKYKAWSWLFLIAFCCLVILTEIMININYSQTTIFINYAFPIFTLLFSIGSIILKERDELISLILIIFLSSSSEFFSVSQFLDFTLKFLLPIIFVIRVFQLYKRKSGSRNMLLLIAVLFIIYIFFYFYSVLEIF